MCFETVYLCAICSTFQWEGHYLSHRRRFCYLGRMNSKNFYNMLCPLLKKSHPSQALACSVCHPDYGLSTKSVSLLRPPIGSLHKYGDRGGLVSYVYSRNPSTCQRITKRVKNTHESSDFRFYSPYIWHKMLLTDSRRY